MRRKTTVRTYLNEDQRWIAPGGIAALKDADTITLDRSAFDFVTAFPNGFLPSGVVLAQITAGGKYGPYASSPSETQTLTRTSTGGTITLTFDGETTAAISASAAGFTAAATQAALEGLSNINPGDAVVSGSAGGPLTVTFGGQYLGQNVSALVVDNTSATGGTIVQANGVVGGGSGSGGLETAVGFLVASVAIDPLAAAGSDIIAALLWHGEIDESALPTNHGLDAAAKADLAAKFRFI